MNNKHVKDGLNGAIRETQRKIEVRHYFKGTSQWLCGKDLPASAEDTGLIPRLGRSPGEGNGNPLQCSCLGNPMDRGAWQAAVHGVAKR